MMPQPPMPQGPPAAMPPRPGMPPAGGPPPVGVPGLAQLAQKTPFANGGGMPKSLQDLLIFGFGVGFKDLVHLLEKLKGGGAKSQLGKEAKANPTMTSSPAAQQQAMLAKMAAMKQAQAAGQAPGAPPQANPMAAFQR